MEKAAASAYDRAQRALDHYRPALSGKSLFFFPDSQLEIPIARFLSRELGMTLLEVGSPYINQQLLAPDLALLPNETKLSEARMWTSRWTAASKRGQTSPSAVWASPTRLRPRD